MVDDNLLYISLCFPQRDNNEQMSASERDRVLVAALKTAMDSGGPIKIAIYIMQTYGFTPVCHRLVTSRIISRQYMRAVCFRYLRMSTVIFILSYPE